jgi:predicted metal-dependent hydrolase
MRKAILFVWLLIPVAVGAYHYGPGQDRVRADRAADAIERAEAAAREAREIAAKDGDDAARGTWAEAEAAYAEAIDLLPQGEVREARALRLERAKAQMFISQLPEACHDLAALVDEISSDSKPDEKLANDARAALANAQYYTTWLMRLEGASREEWEPQIEASRQNYKLVAEKASKGGDAKLASATREDLESAIRLGRMDLSELQGLPLPSQ